MMQLDNWTVPDLVENRGRYLARRCIGNLALADEYAVKSDVSSKVGFESVMSELAEASSGARLIVGAGWNRKRRGGMPQRDYIVLATDPSTATSTVALYADAGIYGGAAIAPPANLQAVVRDKIYRAVDRLLLIAKDEQFQDGVDSNLSLGLSALIGRDADETMNLIEQTLASGKVIYPVFADIVHWLGRVESPTTKDRRLLLLVSYLSNKSSLVRDAASVGLAYLNDRRAVPYVKAAIAAEPVPALREDLQSVMWELEH